MLYHSPNASGIDVSSATQVAEYTIRDKSSTPDIPNSVDVDVQYIDSMYLPVAMEAVLPGKNPPEAGYIGTTNSVDDFEKTLKAFVSPSGSLNGYFGSAGWPQIYLSDTGQIDPNALIKIPGAYNVFVLSVVPSPLNPPGTSSVPFITSSQLNGNMPASPSDAPNYAVEDITNLIFSWAEFYKTTFQDTKDYVTPTPELTAILDTGLQQAGVQTFSINAADPKDLDRAKAFATTVWKALNVFSLDPNLNTQLRYVSAMGTTTPGSNLITGLPASTVSQLQNVMGVVGPNLPGRDQVNNPTPLAQGQTSIQMTQPANPGPGPVTTEYRFYYDTLPTNQRGVPALQATSQLISYILGDNVGDLKDVPGYTTPDERQKVTADLIIPLLHGVPSPAYPQRDWYPTPGNPQTSGNAKYNLDPLVWLVHSGTNWPPANKEILAYAFSVDDGLGNITVNDSDAFEVTVGGSNGLTHLYPYNQPPKANRLFRGRK